jgi:hypothetical protein
VSIIRAIALMMEAARTSEKLVNFYQTTRCYNPEDSNLHTHRRENFKSYVTPQVIRRMGMSITKILQQNDLFRVSGGKIEIM